MDSVPKETFESMYAGQAQWDIGRPQPAFLAVADQIIRSVLDAGCGTGDHALYFASRSCQVTAIDFVEEAISRAKKKAEDRNLPVTFLVKDALELKDWSERFGNVIDLGLFHVFSDQDRQRYVEGLAAVLKQGGRLFLLCFSDEEPGTQGPRRVSKQELHAVFASGWVMESIQPARLEVISHLTDMQFSEGGPKAWFAVIRRAGGAAGSGGP
ncbi:SAM-dependent methyltransferase [Planctomycetaceae bacterium SCGC AG-212-F19]|nr:SAM-dependent methyltransferase [Planctomycetaceae bacterium SCGC AG-212-F19]